MNNEQKANLLNILIPSLGILSIFSAGFFIGCAIENAFFLESFLFVCGIILVTVRAEAEEETKEGGYE